MNILETAKKVLSQFSAEATKNAFGSAGELRHAVEMLEKWGPAHERRVISALARIASQRGIVSGDAPFVWDEAALTHHVDPEQCRAMCHALAPPLPVQGE
jgi:hypothetical protein